MAIKKTTEQFISECLSVHGTTYDYSKTEYVSDSIKVKITCQKHGEWETLPSNHTRLKSGCPSCAGNKQLTTLEFIERARLTHGDRYSYEKTEYTRSLSKVTITCTKHGDYEQAPAQHLRGRGCPVCAGKKQLTTEDFISRARKIHGDKYDYSQSTYKNQKIKIKIRCVKHDYFFYQTHNNHILQKSGCPICAGRLPITTEDFISRAKAVHGDKYDYSAANYTGCQKPITIICTTHGEFQQSPDNHTRQASGCPTCAHGAASKAQLEIEKFLSEHTETISEYRFDNTNRRLDIFLPKHNIAIEYNGNYWHSSACTTDSYADYRKFTDAKNSGIRVIFIFEDEWAFNSHIIKKSLLSAVGASKKIHARDCTVVRANESDARLFHLDNHLQGHPTNCEHYGLLHNGELVACMSFGIWRSNRRNTDKNKWELFRYSCSTTIVGGASRLLHHFIKDFNPKQIISYSDNRLFSGNMYEKLGFTKTHETRPDYRYVTGQLKDLRLHKSRFQKKHLVKMFPGCDIENKTEKQICAENGWFQIYDCGKACWKLDLTQRT